MPKPKRLTVLLLILAGILLLSGLGYFGWQYWQEVKEWLESREQQPDAFSEYIYDLCTKQGKSESECMRAATLAG